MNGARAARSLFRSALLWPMLAVVLVFSLAPAIWVVVNSVRIADAVDAWTLANFGEILRSPFYRQAFGNSFAIALYSSVIALLIAVVAVTSLTRVDTLLRDLAVSFTNMAGNLSGVPLAFAFIVILGSNGALTLLLRDAFNAGFNLYSQPGLVLVYTYFQIPLAVLMLYPAFDALRDEWREAAALLGASRWAYWRHVGVPLLLPALFGAFILLFANALGAYASAYALMTSNYNLVTIRIASLVAGDIFLEPNLAAALSVLLMALLILVATVNRFLLRRSSHV